MNTLPASDRPVVLITGATGGIGSAAAARLAACGYWVFGAARRPDAVRIPGVVPITLDVTSPTSVQSAVAQVMAQTGRIDVLINNAGIIGPAAASEEMDPAQARALFETNFFGVVTVINTVLPIFRRQRRGKIVNISSVTGLVGAPPFFEFYAATKAALEMYTEGLRHEVRPFNIQVALVEPGYTHTAIGGRIESPLASIDDYTQERERVTRINQAGLRYGSPPELVAETVAQVVAQAHPALRNPCGADCRSILTARRWLPAPWFERLIAWMFLDWRPRTAAPDPSPAELGVRRVLFHAPTLRVTLRAAWTAAGAALLAAGLVMLQRSRPRRSAGGAQISNKRT